MLQRLFLTMLMLSWISGAAASDTPRFALLIGNENYQGDIAKLRNPHNDVDLMERTLKGLGFEVAVVSNANLGTMQKAVNTYVRKLTLAGRGAIGLFYYSGHGAQDEDTATNYLIPVDVTDTGTDELWSSSLKLEDFTAKLEKDAPDATHFVVFDACRNSLKLSSADPTKGTGLTSAKGFTPIPVSRGMLIAYATASGDTASDVGAYAVALAEEMAKPGVEAVTMFRNVQRRVLKEINQEPWLSYGAIGDIYLAGEEQAPQVAAVQVETDAGASSQSGATQSAAPSAVMEVCEKAATITSPAVLEAMRTHVATIPGAADCLDARLKELQQVAALAPTETIQKSAPPTVEAETGAQASARDLQTELKRVGCYSGTVDGEWGPASIEALEAFATQSSVPIASPEQPTVQVLESVRKSTGRVCPLTCPAGSVERDGSCVAAAPAACPSGQVRDADGDCRVKTSTSQQKQKSKPKAEKKKQDATTSGSGAKAASAATAPRKKKSLPSCSSLCTDSTHKSTCQDRQRRFGNCV